MRSRPEGVEEETVAGVVAARWGLRIGRLRYVPEGGGAYHWVAQGHDGRTWFVTCDDLDTKPWLGAGRDAVFDGLLGAYGTAMALRAAGLSFVAAPLPTVAGAPAERIDDGHSVSVLAYAEGEPGRWGRPVAPGARGELVAMLARLHRAAPGRGARRRGLDVPGRAGLDEALDDLDGRWDGGPLSEPARRVLAGQREEIVRWLGALDRFAAERGAARATTGVVVTHGEPHPGNLIRTGSGLVLLDWDTVALARPERDLWMAVDADDALVSAYRAATGITPEPEALAAYRLLWALTDVAAFTARLRGRHRRDADSDRALAGLRSILAGREPSPYGPPEPRPR